MITTFEAFKYIPKSLKDNIDNDGNITVSLKFNERDIMILEGFGFVLANPRLMTCEGYNGGVNYGISVTKMYKIDVLDRKINEFTFTCRIQKNGMLEQKVFELSVGDGHRIDGDNNGAKLELLMDKMFAWLYSCGVRFNVGKRLDDRPENIKKLDPYGEETDWS
jgi:hypothetical protein